MKKSLVVKLILAAGMLMLVWLFFIFDLDRYFSLTLLKSELDSFRAYYGEHRALTIGVYMGV